MSEGDLTRSHSWTRIVMLVAIFSLTPLALPGVHGGHALRENQACARLAGSSCVAEAESVCVTGSDVLYDAYRKGL